MAVVAFVVGSVVGFLAAILAYFLTGIGFGGAALVYLGGSIAIGLALLCVGKLVFRPEPDSGSTEPQTLF